MRRATTIAVAGLTLATLAWQPLTQDVAAGSHQTAGDRGVSPLRTGATWRAAVEAHAPGALDTAATQVAGWSREELEGVLPEVGRQTDVLRLVERALVLHTDIAVLHRRPDHYDLPAGSTTMTLLADGRAVGQTAGTFHWEFARQLIEQLPQGDDRRRVAQTFYRATATILQGWNEDPELTAHLTVARRELNDDPVLLLIEGTQRQMYAGARAQRFFDQRRRAWRPNPAVTGGRLPASEASTAPPSLPTVSGAQSQAEQLFRRALAADPTLVEARIRLAHVLSDRGRHKDATAQLARLDTTALPPFLAYYAALLTGREARVRNDVPAARRAYERAAAIYPEAPVPHLALSELAVAQGDDQGSLRQVAAARANASVGDVIDPWWAVERAHVPSGDTLLDEMRDAFVR